MKTLTKAAFVEQLKTATIQDCDAPFARYDYKTTCDEVRKEFHKNFSLAQLERVIFLADFTFYFHGTVRYNPKTGHYTTLNSALSDCSCYAHRLDTQLTFDPSHTAIVQLQCGFELEAQDFFELIAKNAPQLLQFNTNRFTTHDVGQHAGLIE